MLIDLSNFGILTIDPKSYPKTLVIALDAPSNHSECGVFTVQEKRIPSFQDKDFGYKLFHISCPPHKIEKNQVLKWYYSAVGWTNAVYLSHPYVYEIVLEELSSDSGDSDWNVVISEDHHRPIFKLLLPDYQADSVSILERN